MKKLIILWLMLSTLTGCDLGLDGHQKDTRTELEKLPPLTTTGAYVEGYLYNGKAVVIKNAFDINAIYQGGFIQFSGVSDDFAIKLSLSDPLEQNMKYDLTDTTKNGARIIAIDQENYCDYDYFNTFSGSLLFVKLDREKFIASGTFEFSSATSQCDTVHITNGRFDFKYTP